MTGAYIDGIGLLGPNLPNWPAGRAVLRGERPWQPQKTVLPPPQQLPPAERRRSAVIVRLTLAIGVEALAAAALDAKDVPTVFTSSGGEAGNCHALCEVLASADRALSPTRFHNSVHNVASGYWGIATGARTPASVLCAADGSFCAGLLEALALCATANTPTLLLAYDTHYPEPLHSARPISDSLGIALLLAPAASARSLARVDAGFSRDAATAVTRLDAAALESLRSGIPAARGLPLLHAIARRSTEQVVLDYLDDLQLTIHVAPC